MSQPETQVASPCKSQRRGVAELPDEHLECVQVIGLEVHRVARVALWRSLIIASIKTEAIQGKRNQVKGKQ